MYAAVNSLALLAPAIVTEDLFAYLLRKLGKRLPCIMMHGLSNKELRKFVLSSCVTFCKKQDIVVRYKTCDKGLSLSAYWQVLQQHHAKHGPGSVLLGLAGVHEHWTCVRSITEKSIMLADSMELCRLSRRHVSLNADGKHQLHPRDTFLVSIRK